MHVTKNGTVTQYWFVRTSLGGIYKIAINGMSWVHAGEHPFIISPKHKRLWIDGPFLSFEVTIISMEKLKKKKQLAQLMLTS
jgi:hypothetical protein